MWIILDCNISCIGSAEFNYLRSLRSTNNRDIRRYSIANEKRISSPIEMFIKCLCFLTCVNYQFHMSANSYLNTTKVHLYSLWITPYNEYTTYFLVYNFLDPGVSSFFLFSVWSDHVNYCVRMQIVMLVWLFVVHAPQDLDYTLGISIVLLHQTQDLTPQLHRQLPRALSTKSFVRVNAKCKNRFRVLLTFKNF